MGSRMWKTWQRSGRDASRFPGTIRFYLSSNIHYILDEACLRGLDMFYRLAAECGALPPAAL